jgi:hypothetical protein
MSPSDLANNMAVRLRAHLIATGLCLAFFAALVCLLAWLSQQKSFAFRSGLVICLVAIVITFAVQLYLAVRLQIDRILFAQLARNISTHGLESALAGLDRFLTERYKLPAHKTNRTLEQRIAGTEGLCRAHWFFTAACLALMAIACLFIFKVLP